MVLSRKAVHSARPAGGGDALARRALRHAGRAVPGLRADHRLHRRGHDAVPVRAMLVGVDSADSLVETIKGQRLAAGWPGIGLLVLLALVIGHAVDRPGRPADSAKFGPATSPASPRCSSPGTCSPFEVTSALLITAALGAMVLAHRERTEPEADAEGRCPAPRIASGQPDPAARPRRLRPAQRGRHARAAARRHAVRAVGQRGHHAARPRATRPAAPDATDRPSRTRIRPVGGPPTATPVEEGGVTDEPDPLPSPSR